MLHVRRGTSSLLLFMTLLFLLFSTQTFISFNSMGPQSMRDVDTLAGHIVHSVIVINGDDDFSSQAGSEMWPGSGTLGDPYRIENYLIDGTASNHCISISNTQVYFEILNCTLRSLSGSIMAGIYLAYVGNAHIIDNVAFDGSSGLSLYYSDNNTVDGNSFYNSDYGMYLTHAENNTIYNNDCYSNEESGIALSRGSNNRIMENNCTWNRGSDISGWRSLNNNITGNIIGMGDWKAGIALDECDGCRITDNSVYCCINGIWVYWSDYCVVRNNTVSGCNSGIIIIAYASSCETSHNTCYNNTYAIGLHGVYYNEIFDNNCTDNHHGITATNEARFNSIHDNHCENNSVGISFSWNSYWNNATENTCIENGIGIQVKDETHDNSVKMNLCLNNTYGISLNGTASNNSIEANFVKFNEYGISIIQDCKDNIVSWNNCTLNTWGVFVSGVSDDSVITDNHLRSNEFGVLLNYSAFVRVEVNYIIDNTVFGILVSEYTNTSVVRRNTLVDNGVNIHDNGSFTLVDFNFWSDYLGVDADSDGFGDTPHPIPGEAGNEDPHPVVYHPSRPTWIEPLSNRLLEAGYAFQYDINATAPAPFAGWGIDDTINFAIDSDGVVTNAQFLRVGDHEVTVWVENIYGVNLTGVFMVLVRDTIPPTVNSPADFSFPYEPSDTSVCLIEWTPVDMTQLEYDIYSDGYHDDWGTWNTSDDPITINTCYMAEGVHNITLVLTDEGGNTVRDTVMVTITEHISPTPTDTTPTTTTTTEDTGAIMQIVMIYAGVGIAIVVIVIIVKRKR